jgi:soluble lytic murein transglycosylase-like protein
LNRREARLVGCIAGAVLVWASIGGGRAAAQEGFVVAYVDSETELTPSLPAGEETTVPAALLAFCQEPLTEGPDFAGDDNSTVAPAPSPLDLLERFVTLPLAIAGPPLAFDKALGIPHTPYGKAIYSVALRYALNPLVVAAIVEAESDFNPHAVSRKGARGLMQVMPATGRRFGYRKRDLLNPNKNLEAGARYLRWLTDHFGDDALRVIAAYNAGEGSVERFGGLPPFPETRDYVQKIFTRLGFAFTLPVLDSAAVVSGR